MAADKLLSALKSVRQVASQRWTACCPAHDDSSPSLSIRETDDGRILVYCFGGCSAFAIVAALGLTVADLFPEPIIERVSATRPNHWHAARDALRVLSREVLVVAIAAENIVAGVPLSTNDRERISVAANRIRACAEACA